MWYLYAIKFYSAIKNNEIMFFAGKWIERENIILSEVNQVHKAKGHMFSLICEMLAPYIYKQYYEKY
jgi:hypothetical protein